MKPLSTPKTSIPKQTARNLRGSWTPATYTWVFGLTCCRLISWVSKSQTRALPKLLCTPQSWGLAGWGGGPPAPANGLSHSPSHPHPSFLRLTLHSPHPHSTGSHLIWPSHPPSAVGTGMGVAGWGSREREALSQCWPSSEGLRGVQPNQRWVSRVPPSQEHLGTCSTTMQVLPASLKPGASQGHSQVYHILNCGPCYLGKAPPSGLQD